MIARNDPSCEGQRRGSLLVVKDVVEHGRRKVCVHCDCGKVMWISYIQWRLTKISNCGCRAILRHDQSVKVWVYHEKQIMSAWYFITHILKKCSVKTVGELLQSATKNRIKQVYGVKYVANRSLELLQRKFPDATIIRG